MAKRTKFNNEPSLVSNQQEQINNKLQALSALVSRATMLSGMGLSYDGDRKLYEALGYKKTLTYSDFYNLWSREGIPYRAVCAPCNAIWSSPPRIYDKGESVLSPFEQALQDLVKKHRVWNKLNRADKLLGFGEYSVVVFGFNDTADVSQLSQPVYGTDLELLYIQCYSSEFAKIKSYNKDPNSERFGLPELYEIKLSELDGSDTEATSGQWGVNKLLVHESRILHLVENNLQNEVFGEPRMKNIFNQLSNLQKVLGGSAEMFWRGARPGHVAELKEGYEWNENDPSFSEMQNQLQEYEHNLRRTLYLAGVDMKPLAPQVSDPSKHVDVLLQDISAATNIPKRLLIGSERGELASTQDEGNWVDYVADRMQNWAEPVAVVPMLDLFIQYGVLPEPEQGEYIVEWPDLRTPTSKEQAEIGKIRGETLAKYADSPNSSMILPPEMFMRHYQGLSDDQIQEVLDWQREQFEFIQEEDRSPEDDELESDNQ